MMYINDPTWSMRFQKEEIKKKNISPKVVPKRGKCIKHVLKELEKDEERRDKKNRDYA
jgi:hypothetical protein